MERGGSTLADEVVEESIEFEEEDQSRTSLRLGSTHSVSKSNLHNPVCMRAPRSQAENARRRSSRNAPQTCSTSHSHLAICGVSAACASTRCSNGNVCVSAGAQLVLSPGRQPHAVRSAHADRLETSQAERMHTERLRHDRELRLKVVNPRRGFAKLPDSPVHVKHSLPMADNEDCFAMPSSHATDADIGWCQDLQEIQYSLPASPSVACREATDQPTRNGVPATAWLSLASAESGVLSQGPWNLPKWPPSTSDKSDRLIPFDVSSVDGSDGTQAARAPRFLDDEVEEDIDEDELLHAFGRHLLLLMGCT